MFARLFFLFGWAAVLGAGEGYTLKSQVLAHGPWILAGDVLEPAPPGAFAKVRIRRLGPPGSQASITRDLVLVRLREARLGQLPNPGIQGGPCLVTASQRLIPGSDLTAFGERYLSQRLSNTSGVEIKLITPARDLKVPDRPVRFEIQGRLPPILRGSLMLRLALLQTGEDASELEVGQALLGFQVKVSRPVLKAAQPIRRHEALSAENTTVETTELSSEREEPYDGLSPTAGLKARSHIPAGRMILPSMLEQPKVVLRGDLLRLNVRVGLVSVEVQARCLRDAAVGEAIPMEVVETKKQVQAVVLDAHTALAEP